jgi:hypothetical protein
LIFSLLSIAVLLTGVLYNNEISVSNNLCYCSSKLYVASGLEGLFSVIYEGLFRDLEAGDSQVTLVEGLRLIELVAILGAYLVSVQVLLSLPGRAVEEVHGRVEATGCDGGIARLRRLHRVVMVEATLVGDLLAQVIPRLEAGVREGLSGSGRHLRVVDARVRQGEGGLAVAIVDGVHC